MRKGVQKKVVRGREGKKRGEKRTRKGRKESDRMKGIRKQVDQSITESIFQTVRRSVSVLHRISQQDRQTDSWSQRQPASQSIN